ncbi:MAG: hypothetical protein JWM79_1561 [Nocardioides sp.]|nr:hypothetical protein [Nocardioides sp.]
MRIVGVVTTIVIAALALVVVATVLMSIPDIKRYAKIRSM